MKLQKREFYTVHEVAARWGYTIADVAGWSAAGHFDILTGIPPTMCGEKVVAGEVIISAFDILPMFRRCGTGPQTAWLRRVRTKAETEWQLITDPVAGVEVSVADLLISGQHVHRFEEKNELFRRVSGSTGSVSPYDWEGMLQAVALRIHERGIPASQGARATRSRSRARVWLRTGICPAAARNPRLQGRRRPIQDRQLHP